MKNKNNLSRRTLIKQVSILSGAAMVSPLTLGATNNKPSKALRIAHITDIHIRPEHNALNRAKKCIKDIKKHSVDFFLNTGDTIYAADYDHIKRKRVNEQWAIWNDLRSTFSEFEVHSCIGNHDSWWAAPDKNDSMYGKDYVVKQLRMGGRFYSFDRSNWHFIILDSIIGGEEFLDKEQQSWLEKDLAKLPIGSNVIVISHIPILSVSMAFNGQRNLNRRKLIELFYKHQDKKITCLSGHTHTYDSCRYNGVNYFCNGALSGFWWEDGNESSEQKHWVGTTPPGYAILDLHEDGTVENSYHSHPY